MENMGKELTSIRTHIKSVSVAVGWYIAIIFFMVQMVRVAVSSHIVVTTSMMKDMNKVKRMLVMVWNPILQVMGEMASLRKAMKMDTMHIDISTKMRNFNHMEMQR